MTSPLARVGLFFLGYLLLTWLTSMSKSLVPPAFADITWGVVASVSLLVFTRAVLARERRTPRDIGLSPDSGSGGRLVVGLLLGVAVYAMSVLLISLVAGPLRFTAGAAPSAATVLRVCTGFLALSCMEELGFRAYPLRTLTPAVGLWPAQVIVAVAFGLSHAIFGWSWQAIALGVIPSAFLFGAVASASGGLAMPIGLHAAVNAAQWVVGEKDLAGFGTLSVEPARIAHASAIAPFIGAAVPIACATLLFWWLRLRRRGTGELRSATP